MHVHARPNETLVAIKDRDGGVVAIDISVSHYITRRLRNGDGEDRFFVHSTHDSVLLQQVKIGDRDFDCVDNGSVVCVGCTLY